MKKIFTTLITLFFLAGCQSTLVQKSANQVLTNAPADKAQVVFMRVSALGGAVQASLFDTTSGTPEFIGISSTGTKLAYMVEPGERTFMVTGESADYLQANLEAGKTYYAVVAPRMGVWSARFSLRPIHKNRVFDNDFNMENSKFEKWLKDTTLVENAPTAIEWFEKNKGKIAKKHSKYWSAWNEKSVQDKKQFTLNPADHG